MRRPSGDAQWEAEAGSIQTRDGGLEVAGIVIGVVELDEITQKELTR